MSDRTNQLSTLAGRVDSLLARLGLAGLKDNSLRKVAGFLFGYMGPRRNAMRSAASTSHS